MFYLYIYKYFVFQSLLFTTRIYTLIYTLFGNILIKTTIHRKVIETKNKLIHNQYWQERRTKSVNRSELDFSPDKLDSACLDVPSKTSTSFLMISLAIVRLDFKLWARETISAATFSCISWWYLRTKSVSSVSGAAVVLFRGSNSSRTSWLNLAWLLKKDVMCFILSIIMSWRRTRIKDPGAATSLSDASFNFSASKSPFKNRVFFLYAAKVSLEGWHCCLFG